MGTINRMSSARDLARRCGTAFYDAVERVAGLVQAGLCTLRPAEEPAVPDEETGQPEPWQHAAEDGPARVPPPLPDLLPAPVLRDALLRDALLRDARLRDARRWDAVLRDAGRRPAVPRQALPRRRPEGSAAGGSPEEPEPCGAADYSPPPPEVLTRVLDALREL